MLNGTRKVALDWNRLMRACMHATRESAPRTGSDVETESRNWWDGLERENKCVEVSTDGSLCVGRGLCASSARVHSSESQLYHSAAGRKT